ncbi:hypothetical protein V6N13_001300 [Hibiscus sabdariffa]
MRLDTEPPSQLVTVEATTLLAYDPLFLRSGSTVPPPALSWSSICSSTAAKASPSASIAEASIWVDSTLPFMPFLVYRTTSNNDGEAECSLAGIMGTTRINSDERPLEF